MPPLKLKQISYEKQLSGQQKEAYNFQKVSAVLADFGYITIPLSNDWNGADFIAQELDGVTFLKVQLKSRLTFHVSYCGKQLYICFRDGIHGPWYIYDHDELLKEIDIKGNIRGSGTWKAQKAYHFPTLSEPIRKLLDPYRIPDPIIPIM